VVTLTYRTRTVSQAVLEVTATVHRVCESKLQLTIA